MRQKYEWQTAGKRQWHRGTFLLFVSLFFLSAPIALAEEASLKSARNLLLTGRYSEAAAAFKALQSAEPVPAALGLAKCHSARGEYDDAKTAISAAAEKNPAVAALPAALAELAFQQGDYSTAKKLVEQALELDKSQLVARWIQAELHRTAGEIEAAGKAYEWFVDFYNQADEVTNSEDLYYIGLGAAQFARWNRLSDQFSFLVNELYPEAIKQEPNYWPAEWAAGRLFLEKYNQAQASKSLKAALAINASSPDVLAASAELSIQNYELEPAQRSIREALTINPRHLHAQLMQADIHLANFEPETAVGVLEEALKLNPVSEETLGRLAGAYGMVDGLKDDPAGTRLGKLVDEALQRNPHCGEFFFTLGEALDKGRKFPHAAQYFARAVEVLPQHVGARGQLGLMQMRLGEEATAKKMLEESFEIDPFNVRVINSIKVLEVLEGYETIETEHFILKFDGEKDKILATYAGEYLEQVYPELCRRLDFTPPEKSLFEIFNKARNTDGHGWFSARMVGLPNIHTIGACAGKMVALTSPTSTKQKFNWARVLKHEFVHVINLQQTNFNIPHWFTEALAVLLEDSPRSASWNEMLARRVPAGQVFDLSSINLGFIRPSSSEDWQMAYCQAEIYAEYMIARFGEDAPGKMLAGYRDNLSTAAAIQRSFHVDIEDFEAGYKKHVESLVKSLAPSKETAKPKTFAELLKAQEAAPEDLAISAELAVAHLRRQQYPEAGQLADKVLAKEALHPLATYVKARLLILIGEGRRAVEMLEKSLDRKAPQPEALRLLAALRFKAEDYPAAAELYRLGQEHDPENPEWTKNLAMVYLKSGEKELLVPILAKLAGADADDLLLRKKLTEITLEQKDFAAAADWANQGLQIDVMDANMHRQLAEALLGQDKPAQAVPELKTAILLEPKDAELRLGLAKAQVAGGDKPAARTTLEELLKLQPAHAGAKELLGTLKPDE